MCNASSIKFVKSSLTREYVNGRHVLEVGSRDVNGSVRNLIDALQPKSYVGTDIVDGRGVDVICNAGDLVARFHEEAFDVIISTEMLEHVRDWRRVISNLKRVCKPGGCLVFTTRSIGFGYHAYPDDWWRYEVDDIERIFSDCEIVILERDPEHPGVFAKVRVPENFTENDLSQYALYSIVCGKRVRSIDDNDLKTLRFKRIVLIRQLKEKYWAMYWRAAKWFAKRL